MRNGYRIEEMSNEMFRVIRVYTEKGDDVGIFWTRRRDVTREHVIADKVMSRTEARKVVDRDIEARKGAVVRSTYEYDDDGKFYVDM